MTPIAASASLTALFAVSALAQTQLNGIGANLRIIGTDMAVLETQDVRKDLPCTVTPNKPALGFDLRFHGGYDVQVPLEELEGNENLLTILMRVYPKGHADDAAYFVQRIRVPKIEADVKGNATLSGIIDLGEGSYHVDWLMRDRTERVCSFYWDAEANLAAREKDMQLSIAAGAVEQTSADQFGDEPAVERAPAEPLNIKVLVNFAPQRGESMTLRPADTLALVTMMRRLSREPEFGKFSVVAFNIQEQRVLYRQSSSNKIDFPALGEAVQGVQPGAIGVRQLSQKHGETAFLADLIRQEFGSSADHPDAVIIASPKAWLDEAVPGDELKEFADGVDYPVFYMNYNLYPQQMPWKDSISKAVKAFHGTEYTVSRPRDLWVAISEMVSRIVKSRHSGVVTSFTAR